MENKENYISLDEYNKLKKRYQALEIDVHNYKCRTMVKFIDKINRGLKYTKVYNALGVVLRHTGLPKILFRNFILDNVRKLTLEEYKYVRYKKRRMTEYYFDESKIKHYYIKDLVSIVLPVYNGSKYISQTLESIINQTYTNFELIIVNDGSTDDTLKIIKKYAKKDSRISIIDQENQTLPCALANGFKNINGEYAMWVGGDDVLHNDCIEIMLDDLKKYPECDYVFPNVRLIDENNEPITDNDWRPNKDNPEIVMLPNNMLNFNVIKDCYIAPISLYKSIVIKTLAPFSKNRFCVEDYDYWMRVNDLFTIKHTDTLEPLFDYRRHNGSLTSHAKELLISRKTDELMWFEDFRQDYYVNPLIWVIDDEDECKELVSEIKKRNHMIIDSSKANSLIVNDIYTSMIYVSFKNSDKLKKIPSYAYKVLLSDKQIKGKKENYNLYITTNLDEEIQRIDNQRGYFAIEGIDNIFAFIDTKAREFFLRRIEDYIADDNRQEDNIISCVVCTYKRTDKVPKVLESLINQSYPQKNYEILVVNNDIYTDELKELVDEFRKKYKLSSKFLRYVEAPIKGNAYARAVGGFDAKGEYIHWFDDDSIADKDNLKIMNEAFNKTPDACVMGGNIYLVTPDPKPKCVLEKREVLWSQYIIPGNTIRRIEEWYRYPYGANYATVKKYLLKAGIFRLRYGRVGHNWIGGEETSSVALMDKTEKNVYVEPKAFVHHDVQEHRFTFKHVRNSLSACSRTQAMMEQDLMIFPALHNVNQFKRRTIRRKIRYLRQLNSVKRYYLKSDYIGFKIALDFLHTEMNERIKYVVFRRSMLHMKKEFLSKRI